jgi:ribosomal protein S16
MLKIRLRRMGARNRPYYRIVVSDSRRTARAEVLEELGSRSRRRSSRLSFDRERAPSDRQGRELSPTVSRSSSGLEPASARRPERMKRLIETVVRRLSDHPDETRHRELRAHLSTTSTFRKRIAAV